MIESKYGKFINGEVITFLQAIGKEVLQPDLTTDLFEGNTYRPEDLEDKYGAFQGFLYESEMPLAEDYTILVKKWTILQVKKKENKT